jgi:hypothetical protein
VERSERAGAAPQLGSIVHELAPAFLLESTPAVLGTAFLDRRLVPLANGAVPWREQAQGMARVYGEDDEQGKQQAGRLLHVFKHDGHEAAS